MERARPPHRKAAPTAKKIQASERHGRRRRRCSAVCCPVVEQSALAAEVSARWQLEAKHCPAVLRVRGFEVPILGAGEAQGDGEPDARAPTTGAAAGSFGPVEALEDAGEVLGGDSGTRVPHGRLDQVILFARGYLDATPRGREPQGVV